MIKILKVTSHNKIENQTLRQRAKRARGGRSNEFIALLDDNEAGLLSYDYRNEAFEVFIYEIYVLPEFRNKGIGSQMLAHAEKKAIQLQCLKVKLEPFPLDKETKQTSLINWYKDNGYIYEERNQESLVKHLAINIETKK